MIVKHKLSATEARDGFSNLISQVKFAKKHVIIERNGREEAAVIPMEAFRLLRALYAEADAEEVERALNTVGMTIEDGEVLALEDGEVLALEPDPI